MRPAIIATIVIIAVIIAIAIFSFTTVKPATKTITPEEIVQPTGRTLTFPIGLTKQFFTQQNVTVRVGDTIVFNIIATDLDHRVSVPRYGISVAAPKGTVTSVTFVAKPGASVVYCTDQCDPNVTLTVHAQ